MNLKKTGLCLVITLLSMVVLFSTIASAQGTDDGKLFVTTKNEKRYIGIEKASFCTQYFAANGDGDYFYRYDIDLTGDNGTDITDLVAFHNAFNVSTGSLDLNFDNKLDSDDLALLRMVLISGADIEIN